MLQMAKPVVVRGSVFPVHLLGVLQAGGQYVRQLVPQAGLCLCFPLHMRVDVLPSEGSYPAQPELSRHQPESHVMAHPGVHL